MVNTGAVLGTNQTSLKREMIGRQIDRQSEHTYIRADV